MLMSESAILQKQFHFFKNIFQNFQIIIVLLLVFKHSSFFQVSSEHTCLSALELVSFSQLELRKNFFPKKYVTLIFAKF